MTLVLDDRHAPSRTYRECWARADDVLWRATIDGVVVLVPSADEPVVLGGPAAAVWHLLEHPTSLGVLCQRLTALYDVSASRIVADVAPLLDELDGRGVLRYSRPAATA